MHFSFALPSLHQTNIRLEGGVHIPSFPCNLLKSFLTLMVRKERYFIETSLPQVLIVVAHSACSDLLASQFARVHFSYITVSTEREKQL